MVRGHMIWVGWLAMLMPALVGVGLGGCHSDRTSATEGEGEGEGEGTDLDGGFPDLEVGAGTDLDTGHTPDVEQGVHQADLSPCEQEPRARGTNHILISHSCSAAGGLHTIYDLRDPTCPKRPNPPPTRLPGLAVELRDVVVTAVYPHEFLAIADPRGGTFSGIWVYNNKDRVDVSGVRIGDVVRIKGQYQEFYGLDEVSLDEIEVIRHGEALPPLVVEDPTALITNAPLAEPLEGMLLQVRDVEVASTVPDCPYDYGDFMISGRLRVGDLAGGFGYVPLPGDVVRSVTGVLRYSHENTKLEPRVREDLDVLGCNGRPEKCPPVECIAKSGDQETGELVITEIQYDPKGYDMETEWFEVYNPGAATVNLRGWTIKNCYDKHYTIPAAGNALNVPARGYRVLGVNSNSRTNGGVTVLATYDGEELQLSNNGGSILLYNPQGELADQVRYEVADPWPPGESGASLMLRDPALPNEGPDHWTRSTKNGPGGGQCTPGAANE